MYSSEECVAVGCQCERCAKNTIHCCFGRDIKCPDSENFDHSYVCPDFTPREEDQTDATD